MDNRRHFTLFIISMCYAVQVMAQFYTLQPETPKRVKIPVFKPVPKEKEENMNLATSALRLDHGSGLEVSIERDVPVFVNLTDSLLFGLIRQRMNVCLPLDFLKLNSAYGYRKDPIIRCSRFHDGIDLQCNHARVYAMLPGVVKKVHWGNNSYGNYVILNHGTLECLYGHLDKITVRENDTIQAGTIIGISGNSGKSTGPHLHIRLQKDGRSINPDTFVAYLNSYITELHDKMSFLRFGTKPDMELNITNLYAVLEDYSVKFPKIVVAQALLETGYFTSNVCLQNNNLFGLRRPSDGRYYSFNSWQESVKAYRDYVQYKYKGGNYFDFLNRIGYAEDNEYINKIGKIVTSL